MGFRFQNLNTIHRICVTRISSNATSPGGGIWAIPTAAMKLKTGAVFPGRRARRNSGSVWRPTSYWLSGRLSPVMSPAAPQSSPMPPIRSPMWFLVASLWFHLKLQTLRKTKNIHMGLISADHQIVNQAVVQDHGHNRHGGGHHHGIDMEHPVLALTMTIMSISVKEGLYWITKRAGERQNSGLMIANAWHHRADAISSVVALIGEDRFLE